MKQPPTQSKVKRGSPQTTAMIMRAETRVFGLLSLFVAVAFLAGCAASRPAIRSDSDRSADFSSFESYGFPDELGTDRAGYSTLITSYFRDAVHREMRNLGYRYTQVNPDLLVNFFASIRDVTAIRPRPNAWLACGYYGYRYGMYSAWTRYGETQILFSASRALSTSILSMPDVISSSGRVWPKAG
jgi:hypothetical protein